MNSLTWAILLATLASSCSGCLFLGGWGWNSGWNSGWRSDWLYQDFDDPPLASLSAFPINDSSLVQGVWNIDEGPYVNGRRINRWRNRDWWSSWSWRRRDRGWDNSDDVVILISKDAGDLLPDEMTVSVRTRGYGPVIPVLWKDHKWVIRGPSKRLRSRSRRRYSYDDYDWEISEMESALTDLMSAPDKVSLSDDRQSMVVIRGSISARFARGYRN